MKLLIDLPDDNIDVSKLDELKRSLVEWFADNNVCVSVYAWQLEQEK